MPAVKVVALAIVLALLVAGVVWAAHSSRPSGHPDPHGEPARRGAAPVAAKAGARNLMGSIHSECRQYGIRATTILPAEVDTPILDKRPLNPDAKARSTMMQPEDVARAIMLCVTLPPRTVIEEIVMVPTIQRDTSADIRVARDLGGPEAGSR